MEFSCSSLVYMCSLKFTQFLLYLPHKTDDCQGDLQQAAGALCYLSCNSVYLGHSCTAVVKGTIDSSTYVIRTFGLHPTRRFVSREGTYSIILPYSLSLIVQPLPLEQAQASYPRSTSELIESKIRRNPSNIW